MKTTLNPETLPRHPAFSQAIAVRDPSVTIYVGGQNGVRPDGEIVGDTLREQTAQAYSNLESALAAADASIEDVVHWTIAVVDGQSIQDGFAAFAERYPALTDPPAMSVHVVAGLADARFLVEIDAIAVR
jgi:enamine deaminase RidA (YjgF/YER057c/UK114 family)